MGAACFLTSSSFNGNRPCRRIRPVASSFKCERAANHVRPAANHSFKNLSQIFFRRSTSGWTGGTGGSFGVTKWTVTLSGNGSSTGCSTPPSAAVAVSLPIYPGSSPASSGSPAGSSTLFSALTGTTMPGMPSPLAVCTVSGMSAASCLLVSALPQDVE